MHDLLFHRSRCGGKIELMSARAFSIHGHFYQPPREDPVSGLIPIEHGASPYRNWNERIHAECYLPNAKLGNFERISFNIGPTLFSWMNSYDPSAIRLIVGQDRLNMQNYGVGNAIAQSYNHTILPLATHEDKVTQVEWGIADFEYRFGRKPTGMWLPETAVDMETLNILAEHGIEFTILAPWQAETYQLDVTHPYRVALAAGKSISVFFYHQGMSSGISFNPVLTINADDFARNVLVPAYQEEKEQRGEPQLLLIASDGELYGHHQQFRDRFLAHLVNGASANLGLEKTYPALWLKKYPTRQWVSIRERTSWSCHHGVERWNGNCGCNPGDGRWKRYLRQAFNRLAYQIDKVYVETLSAYQIEPWKLRNDYIHAILGQVSSTDLINQHAGRKLEEIPNDQVRLLLEAQRERQRIFTSCGWFFDDFNRIEPKNNVAYAAQAVRLTYLATGVNLSEQFTADLHYVVSQRTGTRGDKIFKKEMQKTLPVSLFHQV
jgi:alpha-amylase/alpha-mannosidase (GH57 family)